MTTGDGVAAAYRAGVEIMDMEFIQFHPTTLYDPDPDSSPFLISETVRGEGGVLRNSKGERFMPDYHELADLAPRDIVSRAINREINQGKHPYVWLDVTDLDGDYIEKRFPTIFSKLKDDGIDIREEYIPVRPAAHYMMGGIKTDINGQTSLPGFYACGEVACTGVHGANRLASNSLLEGLVFGYRIYQNIKQDYNNFELNIDNIGNGEISNLNYDATDYNLEKLRNEFKQKMMDSAGIIREKQELKNLIKWIENTLDFVEESKKFNEYFWEFKNMLTVGYLINRSALIRKESRGGHYRSDFPEPREDWNNIHIIYSKDKPEGEINVLE